MNVCVKIRQYKHPEDYVAVCSLWETAGSGVRIRRSDEADEIEKKIQRDSDLFLVAEAGSEIIGSVVGGFDGRRGLIYHLAVAADYRQKGLGTTLMQEVEQRLRQKGCLRCYLLVAKDNQEGMRFYEQREWKCMDDIAAYAKDLT